MVRSPRSLRGLYGNASNAEYPDVECGDHGSGSCVRLLDDPGDGRERFVGADSGLGGGASKRAARANIGKELPAWKELFKLPRNISELRD
jgi:hypothetical protein